MIEKHPKKSFKATIEHKDSKAWIEADNTTLYDVGLVFVIVVGIIFLYLFKRDRRKTKTWHSLKDIQEIAKLMEEQETPIEKQIRERNIKAVSFNNLNIIHELCEDNKIIDIIGIIDEEIYVNKRTKGRDRESTLFIIYPFYELVQDSFREITHVLNENCISFKHSIADMKITIKKR